MRKIIKPLIALLIVAILIGIGAQIRCKTNICNLFYGKTYEEIDKEVSSIDKKNLKEVRTKLIDNGSTEGGEMITYYNNDNLVKIKASYFGEMGSSVHEFYFNDDDLIYVKQKTVEYDMPFYIEDSKEVGSSEDVFYFKDKELIRWISDDDEKSRCNKEYKEMKNERIEEVKGLKNLIKNNI